VDSDQAPSGNYRLTAQAPNGTNDAATEMMAVRIMALLLLILPVWIRNQSCVMGIGLRCFGQNIADADAD
jgi:hypothetical protein